MDELYDVTCILIKLLPAERQKNFLRHKKIKQQKNHWLTYIIRNVKESPLGKREMLPHGSLDLHKQMKSTRNGKYVIN